MIKDYFSATLKALKKFISFKKEKQISNVDEEARNTTSDSNAHHAVPVLSQTKSKADVLVFDTKKRIFVVKKRCHTVAIYNPENYKITTQKINEEPSSIQFSELLKGNCLPFSGNWFHAEQTDMGLYCSETGTFYLHDSEKKTIQTIKNKFHIPEHGIIPITGDWLGNGKKSIGVFNKTTATFFIKITAKESTEDKVFSFGSKKHDGIPLIGDWNGDGKDTIGLYLPKQGVFFLHNDLDECLKADINFHFGPQNSTYKPIVGDWNGDGKDTIGLYDSEQGLFLLNNKNEGTDKVDYAFHFGPQKIGLIPVEGDWNGEGQSGVGLYDPEKAIFYLTQKLSGGAAEMEFEFPKETSNIPFVISYIA